MKGKAALFKYVLSSELVEKNCFFYSIGLRRLEGLHGG